MVAKILANFVGEVYAVALLKKASEPFLKHWTYMYPVLLTVMYGQKYSNKLSMKALVEKDILMKKQG